MGLGPLGSRNLSTDSIGFLEVPKPPMDILELLGQQSQTCFSCSVYHQSTVFDTNVVFQSEAAVWTGVNT